MKRELKLKHHSNTTDVGLLAKGAYDYFVNIEDEVVFVKNLRELPAISRQMFSLGYNAIIKCTRGRVELEVGGGMSTDDSKTVNRRIAARSGELILLPSNKLLQPMMVSTDVEAGVLLVSDKVLREVLGPQLALWNRAVFLDEVYVVDAGSWIKGIDAYVHTLFHDDSVQQHRLFREVLMSFLRTTFLVICEALMDKTVVSNGVSPHRESVLSERMIFDRFMGLIAHEPQKRQQVSYYAAKLSITPKYLSTVCSRVSGKSPNRWITESVMDDIYQLLRNTAMSVKEISNKLGFPNPSFFGQYFRDEAGMTPLEYRQKSIIGR